MLVRALGTWPIIAGIGEEGEQWCYNSKTLGLVNGKNFVLG